MLPGNLEKTDSMETALLVNYWYSEAVGHVVEGLRYCLGYSETDPDLRIGLILNAAAPCDVAALCPLVRFLYPVPCPFVGNGVGAPEALSRVPRSWSWIVDDPRRQEERQLAEFPNLRSYYAASDTHFQAQKRRGIAGSRPPDYVANRQLHLPIPAPLRKRARTAFGRGSPRIIVMTTGAGPRHWYPSNRSWNLILDALSKEFPDARIGVFGKSTSDRPALQECGFLSMDQDSLLERLAFIAEADLFVSPHSGMGFAAMAVGTPWLILSGNAWPEYFFNNVPFHSIFPDQWKYPSFWGLNRPPDELASDIDGEGPRSRGMCISRIREDLPELLDAAGRLIRGRISYEAALDRHFGRLLDLYDGDRARIMSFDGIHELYV